MAFGIGTNTEHKKQETPKGNYQEVAVKCWFTAKGKAMPLMMKVKAEQEEILMIQDLQVLKSEKQWYAGILNWKYYCSAVVYGEQKEFILLFCPDECSWKLIA